MTFTLRALTPSDAAIAAVLQALAFEDPWSEASLAAQFGAKSAVTLGWFEDKELIAFALFQDTAGEADLLTVATNPARHSQGIARRLLTTLIEDLAQRGTKRLTLDVAEDNAPARHLYTSLGFVEDGRRPRYYTHGRLAPADAILMSKMLTA